MNRKLMLFALVGALAVGALWGWLRPAAGQKEAIAIEAVPPQPGPRLAAKAQAAALPVRQVILFSSGVGYFQREGEVEGNASVELAFPVSDVNDLLKSLVLQDLAGGRVSAISYDSHDPIDKTLRSFAIDLTNNPTFGELLNQARGQKVEVVMQASATQPATLNGTILGMEAQQQQLTGGEVELLNLLCADGVRSCKLADVQRVRFLNPVVDAELRRALEVLALAHDSQKKTVSLNFTGEGRRPVRVGYVVENPLWKTSYRLVLDKNGKPFLQGWAMVENTSDDDWTNVRMALVSGRPISFQMDLYSPLYIPRPTVEPELFASLRPPTYNGAMASNDGDGPTPDIREQIQQGMGARNRYSPRFGGSFGGGLGGGLGGFGGGGLGGLGGGLGGGGGAAGIRNPFDAVRGQGRLSFDEMRQRKSGGAGDTKPLDPTQGVASVASAEEIGGFFQYAIDQPVSLPRQKSALLPIINSGITATKISIYNEAVHAKFPLLGVKLKNTTGLHLMQGPITVFDGGSYAGDARLMDLQPNEERLLSFAVDLGMEVKSETLSHPNELTDVRLSKGILHISNRLRQTRTYLVRNRSEHERTLLIEQPINTDWTLVAPAKPAERSRDMYRYELRVPAGKSATLDVVEETTQRSEIAVTNNPDDPSIKVFLASTVVTPKVKEALAKAIEQKYRLYKAQAAVEEVERRLDAISKDQQRLRANLKEVPPTSNAYKRYVEKFDQQETEIEKLQEQGRTLGEAAKRQQEECDKFLAGLTVE